MTWKLKQFLDAHNITPNALAVKLEGKLSRNAVYSMCQKTPERVYLSSLESVVQALRKMTNKKVEISDIIEV